jgi:hypothetical protein
MKALCLLVIATLCAPAGAQVKLSLSVAGKAAGTATLSQSVAADGSKTVVLRIEMNAAGKKARLSSQASYDAKGNPIRKFLETIIPGQLQRQTVVTFDQAGANVVVLKGDGRETKKIGLLDTAPRAAPSEFWFIRDMPKPGAKVKNYVFNADSLTWDLTETTYIGPRVVKAGGQSVKAHLVQSDQGGRQVYSFLDDKGLPVLVDDGRMKMERIQEK